MADLRFDCLDVAPLRYGASPTLVFKLRITETEASRIHAVALRCQIRIAPQRRRYSADEADLLTHLFGDPSRWGETLKPLQLTNVSMVVPSFTASTEVDLHVPCSYDLEVAAGKYFHGLQEGVVPLVLLFSGTVFGKGGNGFWVEQIPWDREASYRLPVAVWRELIELYFPETGWVSLRNSTIDAVLRFKAANAIPSWDLAIETLLERAGEKT